VEAFDLPVGLWPVGAGLLRFDPELGAGVSPEAGLVGGAVVGEDAFNGDPAVGEPRDCPQDNADSGDGGLVVVDLGIGDAGMVVDHRVDERHAEEFVTLPAAGGPGGCATILAALDPADVSMTAAVRDVADLLHVDVDQGAGFLVLVATHYLAGADVDVAKPVEAAARQHGVDGRCRHPEAGRRSRPARDASSTAGARFSAPAPVGSWPDCGAGARNGRPSRRAHRRIPVGPPLRGRPRHVEEHRRVGDRPAVVDDQPPDPQTLNRGESSISVRHEDLRVEKWDLDSSTLHRRSSSFQDVTHQPTSLGSTASGAPARAKARWTGHVGRISSRFDETPLLPDTGARSARMNQPDSPDGWPCSRPARPWVADTTWASNVARRVPGQYLRAVGTGVNEGFDFFECALLLEKSSPRGFTRLGGARGALRLLMSIE